MNNYDCVLYTLASVAHSCSPTDIHTFEELLRQHTHAYVEMTLEECFSGLISWVKKVERGEQVSET